MNTRKVLLRILLFSIGLSVTGFLIDGDPRDPDIRTNVFELFMMSLIMFAFISTLVFTFALALKKVK